MPKGLEIVKSDTTLNEQIEILNDYNHYFYKNRIEQEIIKLEKGLIGENEVIEQLKKSNINGYLFHDVLIDTNEYKVQVDFILITEKNCYFIECKNFNNNIKIDELGNFYIYIGKGKYKRLQEIKSPISQVSNQLYSFKKILYRNAENLVSNKNFDNTFKKIVVFINENNTINFKKAPYYIKNSIVKVDNLIEKIEYIDKNTKVTWQNEERMKRLMNYILSLNNNTQRVDYLEYYRKSLMLIGKKVEKVYKLYNHEYEKNEDDIKFEMAKRILIIIIIIIIIGSLLGL